MVELPRGQDEDVGDGGDTDDDGGGGDGESSSVTGKGKGKEKAKARRFTAVSGDVVGVLSCIAWGWTGLGWVRCRLIVYVCVFLCGCSLSGCLICCVAYVHTCARFVVLMSVVRACRQPTPQEEIRLALGVHKAHLACLVSRCAMVSRWAGDPTVQAAMVSCLPTHLLSKV